MTSLLVIGNGLFSGAFAYLMDVTDIAQKVANTTAPSFQAAFYYGVMNGIIGHYSIKGAFWISKKVGMESDAALYAMGALLVALQMLMRYVSAEVCNHHGSYYKERIPRNYVHLGNAFHLLALPILFSRANNLRRRGLL